MRGPLAVALGVLALAAGAQAKEDLGDLVNAMHGSGDPAVRIAYVRRIGGSGVERGCEILCKLAQRDPDAGVRVEAAKALAAMDPGIAYPSLKELLTQGGIAGVRRHAASGMSRNPEGLDWVLRRVASGRTDKLERVLLVSELGDFPTLDAAAALERIADTEPEAAPRDGRALPGDANLARFVGRAYPPLRSVALRALARHANGRAELPRIAVGLLRNAQDVETVLAALDVCDGKLDREIRGVLPELLARNDARITAAAEIVSKRLDWLDAVDRFKAQQQADAKAAKDGYAPSHPTSAPPPAPPVPMTRPRVDVVYVCDATASASGLGKVAAVRGIKLASDEERDPSVSFRHAFVSMQDTMREGWDPPSMYFPPLFDSSVLSGVRWRQPSMGVDTEGIEVGVVLREVLDRFEWRPGAERRVVVGSDTYVGDLELAKKTVRVHHQAGGLTLSCPFAGPGRDRYSKTWTALLNAAGGK